jgi:hypothetical protein
MNTNDVVRVLDDREYGFAPVGSVDQILGDWARVKFDEPQLWRRSHAWFLLSELEVVDIATWEKAIRKDVA